MGLGHTACSVAFLGACALTKTFIHIPVGECRSSEGHEGDDEGGRLHFLDEECEVEFVMMSQVADQIITVPVRGLYIAWNI